MTLFTQEGDSLPLDLRGFAAGKIDHISEDHITGSHLTKYVAEKPEIRRHPDTHTAAI